MKKYRGVFLKNEREIGLLREANRMVAMILDELGRQVRPGLPTMHFEEIVQNMCREFKVKRFRACTVFRTACVAR